MNKRLQNLIEQCRIEIKDDYQFTINYEFDKQKFAQLIIDDVMEIIDKEIDVAYDQDEPYVAATLQDIGLRVVDLYDMEYTK